MKELATLPIIRPNATASRPERTHKNRTETQQQ